MTCAIGSEKLLIDVNIGDFVERSPSGVRGREGSGARRGARGRDGSAAARDRGAARAGVALRGFGASERGPGDAARSEPARDARRAQSDAVAQRSRAPRPLTSARSVGCIAAADCRA